MLIDRRLIEFARGMRHEPSPTEKIMWRLVRHRRLAGFRFRRQHPIPPYIADFYCALARLVVEVDGDSHAGDEEADRRRQLALESLGFKVLRFWNPAVFDDRDVVLETVYRACVERVQEDPRFRSKLDEWGHVRTSRPFLGRKRNALTLSPLERGGLKGRV